MRIPVSDWSKPICVKFCVATNRSSRFSVRELRLAHFLIWRFLWTITKSTKEDKLLSLNTFGRNTIGLPIYLLIYWRRKERSLSSRRTFAANAKKRFPRICLKEELVLTVLRPRKLQFIENWHKKRTAYRGALLFFIRSL